MFDFISDEHRMIQEAARDFAQKEIAPIAAHFDETGDFPIDTVRKMGKLGFMGIETPDMYGGAGMDTLAYVLALEEICKVDASHGTIMSVNNSLYSHGLIKYGTEAQKQTYLKPVASGQKIGAYSLTEPMSGSDAGNMRHARRAERCRHPLRPKRPQIVGHLGALRRHHRGLHDDCPSKRSTRASAPSSSKPTSPASRAARRSPSWASAPARPARSTSTTTSVRWKTGSARRVRALRSP